ncbi:hypothetical protein [Rhodobacter sp. TJ_12]|uniref:hypothetical protein n=1 Tax=Rhodobacter sp. TJ_12 TaxID=2029399 RepID=UPI001CBFFF27|nr:hypothetical protein [Rhodobacter sp. TJ_12]
MKPAQIVFVGAFGALLSLALSIAYLRLGFAQIDGRFLPDDTYYTLSIARNLFEGRGLSTDGIIQTSGLQPLIVLFELPLFLLFSDPKALVLGAVSVSAIFGALSAALAGMLVARESRALGPGLVTAACVALSPGLSGNALNGLETSLAAALMLWVLWLVQGTDGRGSFMRAAVIGGVAGAALLARIDSVLLLLPAGLWGLSRLGVLRTALVALVAAVVVLPWVLYCLRFGAPVPESGAAVRQIVAFHADIENLGLRDVLPPLGLALGALLSHGAMLIGILLVLGSLLMGLVQMWRARKITLCGVLALSGLLYIGFYLLYLPAFWFFDRYLNPVLLFAAILLVLGFAAQVRGKPPRAVAALALAAVLLTATALTHLRALSDPMPLRADRGYSRQVQPVLQALPAQAVLVAMQSGALGWWAGSAPYAQKQIRVVNLDGVVNHAAKEAIGADRLGDYLAQIGASHFADWDFNALMLETYQGPAPKAQLGDKVHSGRLGHSFDLYQIVPGG